MNRRDVILKREGSRRRLSLKDRKDLFIVSLSALGKEGGIFSWGRSRKGKKLLRAAKK